MKQLWILLLTSSTLLACGGNASINATQSESAAADTVAQGRAIGQPVDVQRAVALEEVAQQMAVAQEERHVTLVAEVAEVCQMKGCWMKLRRENGQDVMVKFKDYALFMPQDIVGKEVVLRGVARYETMSVDELRHYAEDAGKSQAEIEAITQPSEALSFEADGVLIRDKKI